MKRTLADIRENLDHVGCDNETAREMADEIERLRAALTEIASQCHNLPRSATADRIEKLAREHASPVHIHHRVSEGEQ